MELLVVALLVVVGVWLVWRMRGSVEGKAHAMVKAIERVSPTPIAELVVGSNHRLDGVAQPIGQPSASPATGRPCLVYDVWISAFPGDSPSRRTKQGAEDFLVDDGTGVALVRTDRSHISIDRTFEAPTTTLDQVPFADQVLRSQGVSIGSPSTCRLEMTEGIIGPGDPASVMGRVEAADDEAKGLGATYVVTRGPANPVLISGRLPNPA